MTTIRPAADLTTLLTRLVADPAPPPFAFLCREGRDPELLVGDPGDVRDVESLAGLPIPAGVPGGTGPGAAPVLALVPFRQIRERGYAHHDDGAPLRYLTARVHGVVPRAAALAVLPADDVPLCDAAFDVDDEAYAALVRTVVEEEIGRGEGANFVIRRDLTARQPLPPARAALAVVRRLLEREQGAYWTFAVHLPAPGGQTSGGQTSGDLTLVGATPERHVSAGDGEVVMNPISGTYRYPPTGPDRAGLLRFLSDTKEVEELFMVVDEELKMLTGLGADGGRVTGPLLKPMARLAHTEYLLSGHSTASVPDILRATMFAATVTGSPVENACRVIHRHERTGRGHYAGMAALITAGEHGPELDAPILIRTAYLAADGGVRFPVGATLVRHSDPAAEVAETHAKVAGLLSAFTAGPLSGPLAGTPGPVVVEGDAEVAAALAARNDVLAPFWLHDQSGRRSVPHTRRTQADPRLAGRSVLIVDAEDGWTAMLAHLFRCLGMSAQVTGWKQVTPAAIGAADLLVAGPGPGDPRDTGQARIAAMHGVLAARTAARLPVLAVCLSHQILAAQLGLPLEPLARPHQGMQRHVTAFGRDLRVGFYNTYAARYRPGTPAARRLPAGVEVFTTGPDGEVVALRAPGMASVQFHLESVLSPDGVGLARDLAAALLAPVSDDVTADVAAVC